MDGRTLGRTMYFCLFSEKRAKPIDRRGHSAPHGTDGRYTIGGGPLSPPFSLQPCNHCPVRLRGTGVLRQHKDFHLAELLPLRGWGLVR